MIALLLGGTARAESRCVNTCVGVQAARGLSLGGGSGVTTYRLSSTVIEGRTETAIMDEPALGLLAGLLLEAGGRLGVGAELGLRLRPKQPTKRDIRFAGTLQYLMAPYTLLGAGVELGACPWKFARFDGRLCLDLRGTAYFFGNDLPEGQVVAHLELVVGVEFDVF